MHPAGGEFVLSGETLTVDWTAPSWPSPLTYQVDLSRDAGATWEVLAAGVKATAASWIVSGPLTSRALVRVIASDNQGPLGYDTTPATFVISDVLRPPAGVAALRAGSDGTDLILTWDGPAPDVMHGPAAEYRVLLAPAPSGPFIEIGRTSDTSHRTPLSSGPGALGCYEIVPVNAAGESAD
jgi:hypothetical protein